MAIVWGVLVTIWLVRWFVYFARFSMASFFSTHGVELRGIFFFGSLLLAWLDLPAHSALDSGGFLGKAYGASLVEIFFREGTAIGLRCTRTLNILEHCIGYGWETPKAQTDYPIFLLDTTGSGMHTRKT